MAANPPDPKTDESEDWHKRESAGSAVVQIILAAVVIGGLMFGWYRHTQTKKHIYDLDKEGRDLLARDNPKDLRQAREKFAQALALDSKDGYTVSATALTDVLLAGTYHVEADKAAAAEFVQQAEQVNAPIDEHFTADALWLLAQGKVQEADAYIKGVQDRGALPSGLANALGHVRHMQGKLDEARPFFKKAQDIGWRSPRYAADLAESYFDEGDYINAAGFYQKALEANSQHYRAMVGLARTRIARGQDLKKASDDLDTIQALGADESAPELTAMALTARSELRRFEQKYDEAAKLADQAIAADPNYAWGHLAKGVALSMKGDATAAASFDTAIKLDPHVGAFYFEAARGLAQLKSADKAEAFMAEYAKNLKVDDRFHLVYGDLMKGLGNLDKAQTEYAAAIKANGLNAKAHYALGTVLEAKKQMPDAQKEFESALAAQHNFPDAQVELGNLKFEQKAWEDGLQEFAKALVQMKVANVERARIDGLLDDVSHRLTKANQKALAKAWMEQGKQLVR